MMCVICSSPCFIADDEDYIPMSDYRYAVRMRTGAAAGKVLPERFINTMTAFDLLIGNTDRNEGNFGYILNANDMSFVRPAPLFDSGMCLHRWYTKNDGFKPIFRTQEEAKKV